MFSSFGKKMTADSGIVELMDDLGKALESGDKLMLGGGNPAHIGPMNAVWQKRMQEITADPEAFAAMVCNYDPPEGNIKCIKSLVSFFKQEYGWDIGYENVFISNGSQQGFFYLFNLLAGRNDQGVKKKILLPIVPEYIGYVDQGIESDIFAPRYPIIEKIGNHRFKYRIDFDNLNITDDIAAICLSRPTNPTANVVTDEEMERLSVIAKEHNIPLIIDNAYGNPFPQAIFTEASLMWDEHTVLSFSLSKIGLPATRTGIIIARPEIIRGLSNLNAIIGLTSGSIGATLAAPLIESGELKKLAETHVTKYYQERSDFAVEKLMHYLRDDIPYRIHVNEGAFFLWLWCEDFPITSRELYERLKAKDVIIVPGEYFFPGCDRTDWDHKTECVRISFVKSKTEVEAGLKIIAEVVNEVYI